MDLTPNADLLAKGSLNQNKHSSVLKNVFENAVCK